MAYVRVLRTCFCTIISVLTVALWCSSATQAAPSVRAISTLSLDQRLHLPDVTPVTVNGKATTLGDVRAAHAVRLRMAAQAASLGRQVALTIRGQDFRLLGNRVISVSSNRTYALQVIEATANEVRFQPVQTSSGILAGIVGRNLRAIPREEYGFQPISLNAGLGALQLGTIIPMPQSTLSHFAKDYQDFCTAAQATACGYLPPLESWETAYSSGANENLVIVDPLVTDSSVCAAGGGRLDSSGACEYTYPVQETTDYQPASSNQAYVTDCPGGKNEWNIMIDPHGAASVQAYFGTWNAIITSPVTCVIQVFT